MTVGGSRARFLRTATAVSRGPAHARIHVLILLCAQRHDKTCHTRRGKSASPVDKYTFSNVSPRFLCWQTLRCSVRSAGNFLLFTRYQSKCLTHLSTVECNDQKYRSEPAFVKSTYKCIHMVFDSTEITSLATLIPAKIAQQPRLGIKIFQTVAAHRRRHPTGHTSHPNREFEPAV
jgi:hypothetical protein